MEIERKWLIEGFPAGLPLVAQAAMRQGYIATAPAVRIRESTNEAGTQSILCFKEVEFPTVEAARAFTPPQGIGLGREMTEDEGFSMSRYWRKTRLGE